LFLLAYATIPFASAAADSAHPSLAYSPRELLIKLGQSLVLDYDGEPTTEGTGSGNRYVVTVKLDVDGSGCRFRHPAKGQQREITCVLESTDTRTADREAIQGVDLARSLWRAVVASGERNPTGDGGRV